MTESNETIGRVKTVLVFGREPAAKAVISNVIARRAESRSSRPVCFTGAVQFSNPAKKHIRTVIFPIIDRILSGLQLPNRSFELSVMNLGAASSLDVGMNISGFSADVAVFAALFSAGLQIPIADDFVVTGHMASSDGDIRAVKNLMAKVRAVEEDGTVGRFFYPDLEQDQSLKTLSPIERERGIAAVMGVGNPLKTRAVRGVDEVVREVFTEESIVLASLREGFFRLSTRCELNNPAAKVIDLLMQDNIQRFWCALQQRLFIGDCECGKRLLKALVDFLITRRSYDGGMGAKLLNLMRSVPPVVRRLKIEFPLVDTAVCLKLSEFATTSDYEDVLKFLDAIHGKGMASAAQESLADRPIAASASEADNAVFDAVASQINEQTLTRRFGIPIDSARSSYILDSSTVQSEEEFHEILQAFCIHLHRWLGGGVNESCDTDLVRSYAIDLVEKAFRDKGGRQAAYAQAVDGTQGGVRSVLDAVTEQCKRDRYADHVRAVFKDAVSDMKWDDRVRFTRAAMKRLGPFLPPQIKEEPPERFARQPEAIVQIYVESLDKFSQLLRTL